MLTKTANELIGKRAKVTRNPHQPEFEGQIGTVDRIVLHGDGGRVRLLVTSKPTFIDISINGVEFCTCGEGEGCYLCAEKPQELPKVFDDLLGERVVSDINRALNARDVIPRRCRLDLMTPAELAIYNAVQAVEEVGADPLLTDAVVLLQQAREKVADYIDRKEGV